MHSAHVGSCIWNVAKCRTSHEFHRIFGDNASSEWSAEHVKKSLYFLIQFILKGRVGEYKS